jgi:hypothetical protein
MIAGNYSGGLEYFSGAPEVSPGYTEHNGLSGKGLLISPNPAEDVIKILFPEPVSVHKIEIYSINGKIVGAIAVDASFSKTSTVNISHLKTGIYFVKATSRNSVFSGKFVVIR